MHTPTSVTQFREEQALLEQSARLGLSGLASGVSRHEYIQARMARMEQRMKAADGDNEHLLAQFEQEVTLLQDELKKLYNDDAVCPTTIH